jgi:prefoldin subunit 5
MASRSDRRNAPKDNYAEFIERLDTAKKNLSARRTALTESLMIVASLSDQNETGLQLWAQRRARADALLARHRGPPEDYGSLSELHDIALKMESMFRNRTDRVGERLAAIQDRCDEIDASLGELQKSRDKLTTSRMLSQARESLNKAVAELSGAAYDGAVPPVADRGLQEDLRRAREAIILAEALLEVKGK